MDTTRANDYLKTKVLTASPEELQLMLYDGAIRFCEQARGAVRDRRIEESYHLLCRAQKIVLELTYSLRDEIAPETCANMRRLYIFCYERLVRANVEQTEEPINEALRILHHIRQTWVMLQEKLQEERLQQVRHDPGTDGADGPDRGEAPGAGADAAVGATISLQG